MRPASLGVLTAIAVLGFGGSIALGQDETAAAAPAEPAAAAGEQDEPVGVVEESAAPGPVELPDDGPLGKLGAYEKQALATGLRRRRLAIETEPGGKQVGRLHVVNLDVFSEREGFLQWFNIFHVTTREHVIERELLLRPGDAWDDTIVDETRRKLSDSLYTTLVVIAPVKSAEDGIVDLLVVTRDIWSLRLNTNYEIQESTLSQLSFSLSENNVFGRRKTVAFSFFMDLGSYFLGPIYIDKNIAGSRLRLTTQAGAIFARADSEFEGHRSSTTLLYPLWSLRSDWGASISVGHFTGRSRQFAGIDLRTYDNPDTGDEMNPIVEEVPRIFDVSLLNVETSAVRSFLTGKLIQRISAGHRLSSIRPSVGDDFAFDDTTQAAFERDVLPRSERSSALFVGYRLFLNQFKVYRDLDTYDLPEDFRLGPSVSAEVSSALEVIGSEDNFMTGSLSLSWREAILGKGLARLSTGLGTRLQSGELIDSRVSVTASVASPVLANALRVVFESNFTALINETNNGFLVLGGDNGLRGFAINAFAGQRRFRANLELRSMPFKILFTRFGGAVFYDVGDAADRFGELNLKHDIGIGLRTLTPQLQPFVFRFDYAIPLNGPGAGLPGRFIAGVRQAF